MKNLNIFIILYFALFSINAYSQEKLKRYEVKSGMVEYKTTISGKVMGSILEGSGTEKLYFKDWGAMELKETESTQTTSMKFFGKKRTETENTHTMLKLDNGKTYSVDFDNEQISVNRDMAMDLTKAFYPDADAGEAGKSMLESMGGKKVGNEEFMGYDCDVWELSGGKQWLYKGAMLKAEITMLGITTLTQATSANFNISVPDKYFQLPAFPMKEMEGFMDNDEYEGNTEDMDANMEQISKMSFSEWKKMAQTNDEEMQQMSDEELRQTYDMIQKMIKMKQKR
jgi:hypothetical protein